MINFRPAHAIAFCDIKEKSRGHHAITQKSELLWLVRLGETLNKATFYGEPAQLCDARLSKINDLSRLIQLKKFPFYLIGASSDVDRVTRFFQRSASKSGAVLCGKAGKLRRMRTFLALVLIAVMSLQAAAAAVGSYCQHEHDAVVKHVGHHDHQHKKAQQDAYGSTDLDCSMCHVGVIFGLLSELNLVTLSLPHADPVSVIAGHVPAPPFDRPERPNWISTL